MKFFLDNNLPPRLAKALNELLLPNDSAQHLKDTFSASATDIEWLTQLDRTYCWVIITGDLHIQRRPHERLALQEAGHSVIFLGKSWARLDFWATASRLIHYMPEVLQLVRNQSGQILAELPAQGRLRVLGSRA
ncbi:MAG: hypothetical protein Q7P63_12685 [Verrucomicrobiota bacterium JB022]|nr:hypothetical protein [Verrucomicrobiota bacterium JB022]